MEGNARNKNTKRDIRKTQIVSFLLDFVKTGRALNEECKNNNKERKKAKGKEGGVAVESTTDSCQAQGK